MTPAMLRLYDAWVLSGLTDQELAQRSGIGRSSIRRYLRGEETPGLGKAEALAKALGLSLKIE